ncbi:hypothetical protein LTR84_008757 [Exophiala bonariae]|uniref:BTB domain-containing protein n=1 Tax=Exophiala bonariae TaxID=1690606 RepID=A0AAV9MWD5_9EURO|nr:hypothetical protein LTR84_008757 [Exophiala bonariae]
MRSPSYYTHYLVLAAHRLLNAMMEDQMREASEERARLEEVDHDTSTHFAEYLYGGDYNPAEALIILGQEEQEDEEEASCKGDRRAGKEVYLLPFK